MKINSKLPLNTKVIRGIFRSIWPKKTLPQVLTNFILISKICVQLLDYY